MIAPTGPIYISPEEYYKLDPQVPLEQLRKWAKAKAVKCDCGQFDVWKLGRCDMCFCCVTGETDASEDYELK